MNNFEKLRISLRYYLLGKEFYKAVDALEFAQNYHNGTRRNGAPEFEHQIKISHYIRTLLPSIIFPEETIISALLHDVTEDYGVLIAQIHERYGAKVAEAVNLLDKNGKSELDYYQKIETNSIASIVKPSDRIHNIQTMNEVFSIEKKQKYLKEVQDYFLPMIKKAKRNFPKQESAYENLKHMLVSQCELISYSLPEK